MTGCGLSHNSRLNRVLCVAVDQAHRCPLRVIRDRVEPSAGQAMSALPRKPTRQCIAGKCRDVPGTDIAAH